MGRTKIRAHSGHAAGAAICAVSAKARMSTALKSASESSPATMQVARQARAKLHQCTGPMAGRVVASLQGLAVCLFERPNRNEIAVADVTNVSDA